MSTAIAFLPYAQIILSAFLIAMILLQQSAAGAGAAFGGDSFSSVEHTRRGFEKFLFYGTMLVAILFVISSVAAIVL